jgi:hypothetical protein
MPTDEGTPVTLGDQGPEAIIPLKTAEAGDFDSELVPLTEKAVRQDNTIDLKLIAPGWGSSGYYSADVLRADGPAAWPAGTHMYLDHPTESEAKDRPERSVRDLAAVTVSTPDFRESGPAGPGLYAKASVLPQYAEIIDALAPHIGVSIRAHGSFNEGEVEGRKGRVITRISKGESVDFVTKPGAGGKVLALMESLRAHQNEPSAVVSSEAMSSDATTSNLYVQTDTGNYVPYTTTTTTTSGTITLSPAAVSEAENQQEESMELKEAQEQITALQTELEESKTTAQEATARAERAEGALIILEAQGEARKLMENIELPAAAKTRIVTKVSADPTITEGKLDMGALTEAVEAESKTEAEYIESIVGAGKVTDQGTKSGTTQEDDPKVKESFKDGLSKFFGLSEEAAQRAVDAR